MKKSILALSVLALPFFSKAQCTPDLTETAPGIHPTVAENLAPATVGTAYAQTLTVIIPADTTVEIIPGFPTTVPITKAVVTNVTGLPTGFAYACNPATCEFPGGATNCAIITGTATAGQEGAYPISIYVTYYAGSLTADDTVVGYVLNVNPVMSVADLAKNNALTAVRTSPNPFSANANIDFISAKPNDVRVTLFNLLGKTVKTETIHAVAGENTYTLRGANLLPGMYLIELNDGRQKITQRLIKE